MSLLQVNNLLHEVAPSTSSSFPEVAGTTTTRVDNTAGLTTGWGIQIGGIGQETTEILIGTPATGTTITHPASAYAHPANTPVYFIKYNQVVFERSTTGTTGTATPMTNGTITYQADSNHTIFDDTSGSSTYGYRTYFRNSELAVNSTESDWITFAGHSFYSLGKIRDRSRNKLWNSSYVDNTMLDEWVNELKDEFSNAAIQTNEDYALGTVALAFGTSGLGTITTADFSQLRRVWITYDGSNRSQSSKMNVNDYLPDEQFTSTHPAHYFQGDDVVGFKPEGPGAADLVFYRFATTMVNDTDVLPLPMRPFTRSFTDYVKLNAQYKDEKVNQTEIDAFLERERNKFVLSLSPRDKSGPTMIDIVEHISVDDSPI